MANGIDFQGLLASVGGALSAQATGGAQGLQQFLARQSQQAAQERSFEYDREKTSRARAHQAYRDITAGALAKEGREFTAEESERQRQLVKGEGKAGRDLTKGESKKERTARKLAQDKGIDAQVEVANLNINAADRRFIATQLMSKADREDQQRHQNELQTRSHGHARELKQMELDLIEGEKIEKRSQAANAIVTAHNSTAVFARSMYRWGMANGHLNPDTTPGEFSANPQAISGLADTAVKELGSTNAYKVLASSGLDEQTRREQTRRLLGPEAPLLNVEDAEIALGQHRVFVNKLDKIEGEMKIMSGEAATLVELLQGGVDFASTTAAVTEALANITGVGDKLKRIKVEAADPKIYRGPGGVVPLSAQTGISYLHEEGELAKRHAMLETIQESLVSRLKDARTGQVGASMSEDLSAENVSNLLSSDNALFSKHGAGSPGAAISDGLWKGLQGRKAYQELNAKFTAAANKLYTMSPAMRKRLGFDSLVGRIASLPQLKVDGDTPTSLFPVMDYVRNLDRETAEGEITQLNSAIKDIMDVGRPDVKERIEKETQKGHTRQEVDNINNQIQNIYGVPLYPTGDEAKSVSFLQQIGTEKSNYGYGFVLPEAINTTLNRAFKVKGFAKDWLGSIPHAITEQGEFGGYSEQLDEVISHLTSQFGISPASIQKLHAAKKELTTLIGDRAEITNTETFPDLLIADTARTDKMLVPFDTGAPSINHVSPQKENDFALSVLARAGGARNMGAVESWFRRVTGSAREVTYGFKDRLSRAPWSAGGEFYPSEKETAEGAITAPDIVELFSAVPAYRKFMEGAYSTQGVDLRTPHTTSFFGIPISGTAPRYVADVEGQVWTPAQQLGQERAARGLDLSRPIYGGAMGEGSLAQLYLDNEQSHVRLGGVDADIRLTPGNFQTNETLSRSLIDFAANIDLDEFGRDAPAEQVQLLRRVQNYLQKTAKSDQEYLLFNPEGGGIDQKVILDHYKEPTYTGDPINLMPTTKEVQSQINNIGTDLAALGRLQVGSRVDTDPSGRLVYRIVDAKLVEELSTKLQGKQVELQDFARRRPVAENAADRIITTLVQSVLMGRGKHVAEGVPALASTDRFISVMGQQAIDPLAMSESALKVAFETAVQGESPMVDLFEVLGGLAWTNNPIDKSQIAERNKIDLIKQTLIRNELSAADVIYRQLVDMVGSNPEDLKQYYNSLAAEHHDAYDEDTFLSASSPARALLVYSVMKQQEKLNMLATRRDR